MSFSRSSKNLRKKTYKTIHPKVSVNIENLANESEPCDTEESNANDDRVLPELIEEKIRAYLEPLNEQILTLMQ